MSQTRFGFADGNTGNTTDGSGISLFTVNQIATNVCEEIVSDFVPAYVNDFNTEVITPIQTDITSIRLSINNIETKRITPLENTLGYTAARITTAENEIHDDLRPRVAATETKLAVQTAATSTNTNTLTWHATRLTSAESTLTSHESKIAANEGQIAGFSPRLGVVEEKFTSTESRLFTVESASNIHEARLNGSEAILFDHDTRLNRLDQVVTEDANGNTVIGPSSFAPRDVAAASLTEGDPPPPEVVNHQLRIVSLADPLIGTDATPKQYVDTSISTSEALVMTHVDTSVLNLDQKLSSVDEFLGNRVSTLETEAVTLSQEVNEMQYLKNVVQPQASGDVRLVASSGSLVLYGGTWNDLPGTVRVQDMLEIMGNSSGVAMDCNTKRITDVGSPINTTDVTTKAYVDTQVNTAKTYADSSDLVLKAYVDTQDNAVKQYADEADLALKDYTDSSLTSLEQKLASADSALLQQVGALQYVQSIVQPQQNGDVRLVASSGTLVLYGGTWNDLPGTVRVQDMLEIMGNSSGVAMDCNTKRITDVGNPINTTDVTTKGYVDSADNALKLYVDNSDTALSTRVTTLEQSSVSTLEPRVTAIETYRSSIGVVTVGTVSTRQSGNPLNTGTVHTAGTISSLPTAGIYWITGTLAIAPATSFPNNGMVDIFISATNNGGIPTGGRYVDFSVTWPSGHSRVVSLNAIVTYSVLNNTVLLRVSHTYGNAMEVTDISFRATRIA